MHIIGQTKKGRLSDYALQLREKQKVKAIYGLRETQLRRYFKIAELAKEPTGRALIEILERHLDNVVYRLGLSRTRLMARQMISHGHVLVGGKSINLPSYLVSAGQTVSLSEKAMTIPEVRFEIETRRPSVSWLERENGSGRMTALPNRDEVEAEINESLIVEFYSR